MARSYAIEELVKLVGGVARGDTSAVIAGVADVEEAGPDQATWVSNLKYAGLLVKSRAGVVLVPADFGETPMPAILCERIDRAVANLLGAFAPPPVAPESGIHPTAVVHETAEIGAGCAIGPHVVIETDARIGNACMLHAGVFIGPGTSVGDECVIWPNVVIRDGCVVGNRVIIHPCAVVGADGLGFYFDEGRHNKIPHIGGVIVGDDVEIGACTCIDRSKFGNTVIGRGTKIDNQVHVAHNVRIGEHCVFAAQAGLSGSTRVGDYCLFGGRAATTDNVTVGDGARLAGGLAVAIKDVPPGITVSGFPARDHRQELRDRAHLHRLPKMVEQLRELAARVKRLEESADH